MKTLTEKAQELMDYDTRDRLSHWEFSFVHDMAQKQEDSEFTPVQQEKLEEIYEHYCM